MPSFHRIGAMISPIPTSGEFEDEAEGNEIHFYDACDHIPKGAAWMVWSINASFYIYCL